MEGEIRTLPMPKLGLTSKSATLVAWQVQPGDSVTRGTVLCAVETEKTQVDVQSPAAGTVLELCVAEGVELAVGADLLRLRVAPGDAATPAPAADRIRATPAARRLARELGVDLAAISSSPGGVIEAEDVKAAAAGPPEPEAPPPATGWRRVPLSPMRRAIAAAMRQSAGETAPVTLTREVQCAALLARLGDDATITDALVRAVALALGDHPDLHAQWDGDALLYPDAAHVSLAVALPGGLVAPVLRHPAAKDLGQLAAERRTLVERARAGRLTPDDLAGGTITLSNLGMYGVDAFTPIITLPQAAVLGVGRILPRPVAEGSQIVLRPTLTLSLTFDHRSVDGATAAAFLARVAALIEQPAALFEEGGDRQR